MAAGFADIGRLLLGPPLFGGGQGLGLLLLELAFQGLQFGGVPLLQRRLRRRQTLERRDLLVIARGGAAGDFGIPGGARLGQPLGLALLPFALGGRELLGVEHHHFCVFFRERVGVRLPQSGLGLADLLGGLPLQLLDGALVGRELGFQCGQPLAPAAVARRQLRELARRLGLPARAGGDQMLGRLSLQLLRLRRQLGLQNGRQPLLHLGQARLRLGFPLRLGGGQARGFLCLPLTLLPAVKFQQARLGLGNALLGGGVPLGFNGGFARGLGLLPFRLGGGETRGVVPSTSTWWRCPCGRRPRRASAPRRPPAAPLRRPASAPAPRRSWHRDRSDRRHLPSRRPRPASALPRLPAVRLP